MMHMYEGSTPDIKVNTYGGSFNDQMQNSSGELCKKSLIKYIHGTSTALVCTPSVLEFLDEVHSHLLRHLHSRWPEKRKVARQISVSTMSVVIGSKILPKIHRLHIDL